MGQFYKLEPMPCKVIGWETLEVENIIREAKSRLAYFSIYLAIPNMKLDTISSFMLIVISLLDIV